ncbi:MAG: malectin domain-containing carbohydrate-binding protein, partial [bacterium]
VAKGERKLKFEQPVTLNISVSDLASPPNTTEKEINFTIKKEKLFEVRVNCGGNRFVDDRGRVWKADRPYSEKPGWGYFREGGINKTDHEIYDTKMPELYRTNRHSFSDYRFKLPNGRYFLVLHYADISYGNIKSNRFNVKVENDVVYSNFNLLEYSGKYVALQLQHVVTLTDGLLKVWAGYRKGKRYISGIEVYSVPESDTEDTTRPRFQNWFPPEKATVPADAPVSVRILDADSGVSRDSVFMWINNTRVFPEFDGNYRALTVTYIPPEPFPAGGLVSVQISVSDQAQSPNKASGNTYFYIEKNKE